MTPTPILAYHSIDDRDTPISISPGRFREQMEHLRDRGYRSVTLREWMEGSMDQASGRPFVLTFDDGYANNYDVAKGVLADLGFKATIFIVTDHVGRKADWASNDLLGDEHLLDWEQLRELADLGFDLQPHSHTHPMLSQVTDDELEREVRGSRDLLEEKLERPCRVFCYPHGKYDRRTTELLERESFLGAVTTRFGYPRTPEGKFEVRRIGSAWFRNHPRAFSLFMRGPLTCRLTLAAGNTLRRIRGRHR